MATCESIGEDHSHTIRGLEELVKLGSKTLKELGRLGESLEMASRERSFAAVAEFVKDLASREMLEYRTLRFTP